MIDGSFPGPAECRASSKRPSLSLSLLRRGGGERNDAIRTSPHLAYFGDKVAPSIHCCVSPPVLLFVPRGTFSWVHWGLDSLLLGAGPFCYTTRQGRRKQMKLLNCCTHRKESPSFLSRRRPETALPFSHLTAATFGPFPLPTSPKSPAAFLPSLLPSAAYPFPIPILLLLRSLMGLDDRSIYGPFRQSDWKTADTHHNTKTERREGGRRGRGVEDPSSPLTERRRLHLATSELSYFFVRCFSCLT